MSKTDDSYIERIEHYLKLLKYEPIRQMQITGSDEFEIPVLICPMHVHDYDFQLRIYLKDKWVFAKVLVAPSDILPSRHLLAIYRQILEFNFQYPEITFSIDPNSGSIWLEFDTLWDSEYETFAQEFKSIELGLEIFSVSIFNKYGSSETEEEDSDDESQEKDDTLPEITF